MGKLRQIARLMLSFILLLGIVCTTTVTANAQTINSVKMTASVGLKGFYDRYGWVPVSLTFSGVSFTGDAVVEVTMNDAFDASRTALGSLRWGVRLQTGRVSTREIEVPGWAVYRNATITCLVKNQVVATTNLSGNELGKVAFVGVLSDRPEAAQFLTGTTDGPGGLPVLPMTFEPNSLPIHPDLLQSLTAIVTTPGQLATLNALHQQGLTNWVKLGGLLVVTGTTPTAGAWDADLLPLLPGVPHKVPGKLFANFAGVASAPSGPVTVASAGAKSEAHVWAGTDTSPLVAAFDVGRGTVVETSFSPTESTLLSWSNNASLWTQVFSHGAAKSMSALPPKLTAQPLDTLASASAVLAPLRVPSLPFWGIMFVVYVVLVGPVLFFVLRRFRVEPFAWVALPVISLVTTLVMYGFGVQERPAGLLTEGIGVFDLIGDGTAEGYGVRSFMSPSMGPLDVASTSAMMVLPLSQRDIHSTDETTVDHGDYTVVHYGQVGRWSLHDVISEGLVQNQGQVDMELWSSQNQLSGTVRNDTPYTLHNVALCWNNKLVMLGDMGPGTEITLGKSTTTGSASGGYLANYSSYNHDMARGIGRSLGNFAAQTQLLSLPSTQSQVLLVATTTDETPSVPVVVSPVRTSSAKTLVLVRELGTVSNYPAMGVNMQ